jgi:hypothetical protein
MRVWSVTPVTQQGHYNHLALSADYKGVPRALIECSEGEVLELTDVGTEMWEGRGTLKRGLENNDP